MSEIFRHSEPVTLSDDDLRTYADFMGLLAQASGDVIRPLFRTNLAMDNKKSYNFFDPVTEQAHQPTRARPRNFW